MASGRVKFLLLSLAIGLSTPAIAQSPFPSRTVRIVVPYSAGSGTDLIARNIAERLGARLKQTVMIENIAGASSAIGSAAVARAPADGYTMLLNGGITHFSPYLRPGSVSYDPFKSFLPLTYLADTPLALVVRGNFPAQNVGEYVEYARRNPGQVTFGSPGAGTAQHIGMEQLKREKGIDIRHIPHRALATVSQDILGGNLDSALFVLAAANAFVDGKNARIIATCGESRCPSTPDIPSFKEGGVDCSGCGSASVGFLLPAGTPDDIVARLSTEINAVLQDSQFRTAAEKSGWILRGGSSREFTAFMQRESDTWGKLMADPALREPQ